MQSKYSLAQLSSLHKELSKMSKKIKTLSDFHNIKANKSTEGTRVVKFCISPKLMSSDYQNFVLITKQSTTTFSVLALEIIILLKSISGNTSLRNPCLTLFVR